MDNLATIQRTSELFPAEPHHVDFSITADEGALAVISLSLIARHPDFLKAWERFTAKSDAYYAPAYLQAEAVHQDGEILLSWFRNPYGDVFRAMVLRPIHLTGHGLKNKTMHDLINPYQYGGPIVYAKNPQHIPQMVSAAQKMFVSFCGEYNVVSEFIRFHPLLENAESWRSHYKVASAEKNIVIDLRQTPEKILADFSRGQRRNLERCKALGVTVERVPINSKNMAWFSDLYAASMRRLKAKEYYWFPNDYFTVMAGLPDDLISLYVTKQASEPPASALMVLHGAKIAHTHLLGDCSKADNRIPHTMLYYMAALDMKQRQRTYLHLGGASSNQEGVRGFKERLSPLRIDYFTGSIIYDKAAYERLSQSRHTIRGTPASAFFPEYRAL